LKFIGILMGILKFPMRFLRFLLLALVLIIGGIVVAWTAGAL
jgi:hypothetical protein